MGAKQQFITLLQCSMSAFTKFAPQTGVVEPVQLLVQQNPTPTTQLKSGVESPQLAPIMHTYDLTNINPIVLSALEAKKFFNFYSLLE